MNIKVFNISLSKEQCEEDQRKMNEFLDTVNIKLTSANYVTTPTDSFWSAVVFFDPKKENRVVIEESELSIEEKKIYAALREWRNELAKEYGWSAFRICHNSHLIAIARANPQTIEELTDISSFGKARTANYGDDIIAVLNAL